MQHSSRFSSTATAATFKLATACSAAIQSLAVGIPLSIVFALGFTCAPVQCADVVLTFPVGWRMEPLGAPHASTANVFVTALEAAPPGKDSLVVQYRGLGGPTPTTVTTNLPGAGVVSSLSISPDGSRILVHQALPALPEITFRITMINANGTVIWFRDESRVYRFSTTGEVLSAFGPVSEDGAGPELEVYRLDGELVRQVHVVMRTTESDSGYLRLNDAILVGAGERAIVASERSLRCISTTSPQRVFWSLAPMDPEPEVVNIRLIDSGTIVTDETGRGQFRIVDVGSGVVRYLFDPSTLPGSAGNNEVVRARWASYRAFAGSSPGSVVLLNSTSTAYRLDTATGTLTPSVVDVTPPIGFKLSSRLGAERAIFLSPAGVHLRSTRQTE